MKLRKPATPVVVENPTTPRGFEFYDCETALRRDYEIGRQRNNLCLRNLHKDDSMKPFPTWTIVSRDFLADFIKGWMIGADGSRWDLWRRDLPDDFLSWLLADADKLEPNVVLKKEER